MPRDNKKINQRSLTAFIVTWAFAVAIADVPPISWVFDLNETIKSAWVASPEYEPPYGHAEESSLASLTRRTGIDQEIVLKRLFKNGIEPHDGETMRQIGDRYELAPIEVLKTALVANYKPAK